ncbi:MAG: 16S rRNA (cytosine(1402)-N(4))-methyltransferase RsmH [Saccharofermentans sp.]|nr:16S rRNA (cytosine(1402)-N(4))-methyltransferase RsmH [Saccharofermentans sp.]
MSKDSDFKHISVMPEEAIEALNIKSDGIYVDCTLGGGGHSAMIASRLSMNGTLISIDKDDAALAVNMLKKERFEMTNWMPVKSDYGEIDNILDSMKLGKVDGILADVGVSSYQLDSAERGFSYMNDGPLDMRMDLNEGLNAAIVVNTYSRDELDRIFKEYGEERHSGRIAEGIVNRRKTKPFTSTVELAEAIKEFMPGHGRGEDQHPAKRCFQAIRIEVNHELSGLERLVTDGVRHLKPGGRFVVITFHSLEDRIVKEAFRKAEHPCTCPRDFPVCVCGKKPLGTVITKKPLEPTELETQENPRARSAKLRIFERNNNEQYN